MKTLNNEALRVLESSHSIACLCTANKEGIPSGRWVKVVPSDDLSKLYVGVRKLNRALHDLEQNPLATFVISEDHVDPLTVKAFQIQCTLEKILTEGNRIYNKVAEKTKDELARPEASFITNLINKTKNENERNKLQTFLTIANNLETNSLKEVLVFDIQRIFNSSLCK